MGMVSKRSTAKLARGRSRGLPHLPPLLVPIEPDLLNQVASDIRRAQEQRELSADEFARKLANGLRMMRRSRQTVFLGESEHETRSKVRGELSRMGFRVEPQAPSAYSDTTTVRTLLGDAKLAVHFVGNQQSQRPLDAIRDSRQYCQHATIVYEVPGVDLSDEECVSLEWLEADLNPAASSASSDRRTKSASLARTPTALRSTGSFPKFKAGPAFRSSATASPCSISKRAAASFYIGVSPRYGGPHPHNLWSGRRGETPHP